MSHVVYKDRKNTNSRKWDECKEKFGKENILPLWIADMDFEAPACVKEALKRYVEFGVFGYYEPSVGYEEAFIRWEKSYHNYEAKREWIRFSPGVVPAINWIIQILTKEQESVLIMPPVYYPFRDALVNNRRKIVESPLRRIEQGYVMDYEDFEQKIVENDVKLFVFCSPHNPVGRVWKEEEIRKVLDICKKHRVYVIADEIHQDMIMTGHRHVVAASTGDYDEILITLTAATKTFNLAACQNSILIIPDETLREKYDEYLNRLRIKGGNAFGYIAYEQAYANGRLWLNEVLKIITSNYKLLKSELSERLPKSIVSPLEGTYLAWINLDHYLNDENYIDFIQGKCKLAVDYGSWFGGDKYNKFIRINLATSKENIIKAVEQLEYLKSE